jgi:hypothetical protein
MFSAAFVPMTPTIIPGAGGQSPFITWGEIEGTPLRVTERFDAAEENRSARGFRLKESSFREKVAEQLETQGRRRTGSATPKVSTDFGRRYQAGGGALRPDV